MKQTLQVLGYGGGDAFVPLQVVSTKIKYPSIIM